MMGVVAGTSDALRNGMIVSGLLFLVYLPVLILLSGILRSYTTSAWTLTYLRLTAKLSQSLAGSSSVAEEFSIPPEQSI